MGRNVAVPREASSRPQKSPAEPPRSRIGHPEQLRLLEDGWRTVDVGELRRQREQLHAGNRARRTIAEYRKDWNYFESWCAGAGREALPASADTLELYLTAHSDEHKVTTLRRRVAAIAAEHRARGHATPSGEGSRLLLDSLEREKGSRPAQKAAVTPEDLRGISKALGELGTVQAIRDRALLVLGFATGLRRQEIAALQLSDIEFARQGLIVNVEKSKTDQKRAGRRIGIFRGKHAATCPVRTLKAWLKARGGEAGPLFVRTDRAAAAGELALAPIAGDTVNDAVKRCVRLIGLDPAEYGGHSLRAGMITAAAADGVPDTAIMQRSGHKSVQTLKRYIRHTDLFAFDPLAKAL